MALRGYQGMQRVSRTLSVVACCAILVQGSATASPTGSSHPGTDFPNSESFYPYSAKLWAQEGATVVHYCVDANGRLSGEPTVERTSGDDDLDGAALALAKAGDGHYVPAYEAGKAIAACANFKVNFALWDDPSFPTLSRRAKQLTNQSRPQIQSLNRELQLARRPPDLTTFVPGDQQQLMQLRNFVASVAPLVKKYDTLLADFVAKMDEMGRADDVSEAERTAFSKSWQEKRAHVEQLRAAVLDMRSMLGTANDLADYVQNAQPPLWSVAGPNTPNVEQRAAIGELIARGRTEYAELQTSLTKTTNSLAKADGGPQGLPGSSPGTLPQPPERALMLLESVAGLEYSAASMPGVVPPKRITTPKEISDSCSYPQAANRNYEEGTTLLRLHLDEAGAVSAVAVARSSGHEELDAAAVRCIATVRFQPAARNGTPLASVIRYGWTWKMDWGSSDPRKCDELKAAADAHAPLPANNRPEKGAAVVCSCWEESGKARILQIVESSGSQRLDDGAIKLAEAGAGPPRPPGHPGCFAYRIQFELKN
jgi:TonB family protein